MLSIKKRLALAAGAVATVGAVGTLMAGVTFGLFSSTPGGETNNFTSGTVTLTSSASGVCNITQAMPGDSGTCTFAATYTGNAPAYIALDTATSGGLYDPTNTGGLQLSIADNNAAAYALSGTNLFVAADPGSSTTHTFTVSWSLPDKGAANNAYQGLSQTLSLTAHAVQKANNGDGSTCVAGVACASSSSGVQSWS